MIKILQKFWVALSLITVLAAAFLLESYIPLNIKEWTYAFSLTIRGLIMGILPILLIAFISYSMLLMRKKAVQYFFSLITFVMITNFTAIMFGYFFARLFVDSRTMEPISIVSGRTLVPAFLPINLSLFSTTTGLLIGVNLGIFLAFYTVYRSDKIFGIDISKTLEKFYSFANIVLKFVVLPLIPIMVFGMAVKLRYEGLLSDMLSVYGKVVLYFVEAEMLYVLLILLLVSCFRVNVIRELIVKALPATLVALSTSSSAATMPVTIKCAASLSKNPEIARAFAATSNINMVGTAVGMNVMVLTFMTMYGFDIPDLYTYIGYAAQFMILMFGVVGVTGGSIFVMAPLIENGLNVPSGVIAIIAALVMLLDPIDTSTNVTSTIIWSRAFEKYYLKLSNLLTRSI